MRGAVPDLIVKEAARRSVFRGDLPRGFCQCPVNLFQPEGKRLVLSPFRFLGQRHLCHPVGIDDRSRVRTIPCQTSPFFIRFFHKLYDAVSALLRNLWIHGHFLLRKIDDRISCLRLFHINLSVFSGLPDPLSDIAAVIAHKVGYALRRVPDPSVILLCPQCKDGARRHIMAAGCPALPVGLSRPSRIPGHDFSNLRVRMELPHLVDDHRQRILLYRSLHRLVPCRLLLCDLQEGLFLRRIDRVSILFPFGKTVGGAWFQPVYNDLLPRLHSNGSACAPRDLSRAAV